MTAINDHGGRCIGGHDNYGGNGHQDGCDHDDDDFELF